MAHRFKSWPFRVAMETWRRRAKSHSSESVASGLDLGTTTTTKTKTTTTTKRNVKNCSSSWIEPGPLHNPAARFSLLRPFSPLLSLSLWWWRWLLAQLFK